MGINSVKNSSHSQISKKALADTSKPNPSARGHHQVWDILLIPFIFPRPPGGQTSLRLERAVGAGGSRIKPFDSKYMKALSEQINVVVNDRFQKRVIGREKNEIQRRRNLVVNGIVEPEPGEENLLKHPVLR